MARASSGTPSGRCATASGRSTVTAMRTWKQRSATSSTTSGRQAPAQGFRSNGTSAEIQSTASPPGRRGRRRRHASRLHLKRRHTQAESALPLGARRPVTRTRGMSTGRQAGRRLRASASYGPGYTRRSVSSTASSPTSAGRGLRPAVRRRAGRTRRRSGTGRRQCPPYRACKLTEWGVRSMGTLQQRPARSRRT